MRYLHTRLVSAQEFQTAYERFGAIYFVKDDAADTVKIGYAQDVFARISNLQVGCSNRLRFIGLIAGKREIEPHIHQQFIEGSVRGEWFWDRGIITQWLLDMTQGEPIRRQIWRLVPARELYWSWDEKTKSHTKHIWNDKSQQWDPPLPTTPPTGWDARSDEPDISPLVNQCAASEVL